MSQNVDKHIAQNVPDNGPSVYQPKFRMPEKSRMQLASEAGLEEEKYLKVIARAKGIEFSARLKRLLRWR